MLQQSLHVTNNLYSYQPEPFHLWRNTKCRRIRWALQGTLSLTTNKIFILPPTSKEPGSRLGSIWHLSSWPEKRGNSSGMFHSDMEPFRYGGAGAGPSTSSAVMGMLRKDICCLKCLNNDILSYVLRETVLMVSDRGESLIVLCSFSNYNWVLDTWDSSLIKRGPYILWFSPYLRNGTSLKAMCKSRLVGR